MKTHAAIVSVLILSTIALHSQDVDGCRDHSKFPRMPDYTITECAAYHATVRIIIAGGSEKPVEGMKTYISYSPSNNNPKPPSFSQVVKYYEGTVIRDGGTKIFIDPERATLKLRSGNNDIWLSLKSHESTNGPGCYDITIVEADAMK